MNPYVPFLPPLQLLHVLSFSPLLASSLAAIGIMRRSPRPSSLSFLYSLAAHSHFVADDDDLDEGAEYALAHETPLTPWLFVSGPILTGLGLKAPARLREFCRQVQAEVVSYSRNKIHQTLPKPFSLALYLTLAI